MAARRILVMLAVLMGITALSVAVAPPPQPGGQRSSTTPSAGGAQAPSTPPTTIERTISAESVEAPTVNVPLGSTLRLTVEADALDAIEIDQLDRYAPVTPEAPALFELLADRIGSYDVRLVETGRLVGRVEVSSAR